MNKTPDNLDDVFDLLNEKANLYNNIDFIEADPISIPHRFSSKQDIEISGFLTATISWGNRKAILVSAEKMLDFMDNSPYDFIQNFTENDLKLIETKPLHRTFNGEDFAFFLRSLQRIFRQTDSLENVFTVNHGEENFYHSLHRFRILFIQDSFTRSAKHISSTHKNSAAKRLMMFLRWMVRKDKKGVDFGLWQNIDSSFLSIPLDVHTANISRQLGLLQRKQNDWKAVEELDIVLRKYNQKDPAVYDFALFGMGVNKDLL